MVQAVRRFGGVGQRQNIEQAVQLALAALGNKVVHLTDVSLFRRVGEINVQDQRFQQVHLAGIPKTVAFPGAVGVLDDDIHEKLRHQFLPLNFFQAVPRVGIFGADKVEHTHCVAQIPHILAGFFVEFGFWVTDNKRLAAGGALQDTIHAERACFHRAAGTIDGEITVHACFLRDAKKLAAEHPQHSACMLG